MPERKVMIEARGLTKYYGDFPAIEDVSFTIRQGEIVGFLGPNGAGKTTTMRILTGFIPPTSGTAYIAGYDVVSQSLEARRHIGYLPETVPLYQDMTVEEYLRFMGTIRGMSKEQLNHRIDEVIDLVKVGDYRDALIAKLSKGFRQRVGLAQAILHEPEVLILDEPTIGIDPIQVVETRRLIRELGEQHTLILSTHILPEVSVVCERVLIIHEGRLVAEDTPENLAERLQGVERIEMEVRGPGPQVAQALRSVTGVLNVQFTRQGDRFLFQLEVQRGLDLREKVARTVVSSGWGLLRLQLVSMSLEEIFLHLTTREEARV